MIPNGLQLGAALRGLRVARGLTQEQASRAAGVGRVTLGRWESGAHRPRLTELDGLLAALTAGPDERRRVLALMDTPGAKALAREDVVRLGQRQGLGPMPCVGDLLRAMRQRRRLSLEEVAARVGVSSREIRRWERVEAWPTEGRMHALCCALGASEEEVSALTARDLPGLSAPFEATPPLEKVGHQIEELHRRVLSGDRALVELQYLTLENHAWRLAVGGEAGRRLLRRVYYYQAIYLGYLEHIQAASRMAERTLALGPGGARPDDMWVCAGVFWAQSQIMSGRASGTTGGRKLLRAMLAAARSGYVRAWAQSAMANCLLRQGATEEALALGRQSYHFAEHLDNPEERVLRSMDQAGRLLAAARPGEALAWLDGAAGNAPTPYQAVHIWLLQTQAHIGVCDPAGAADCLQRAFHGIEAHGMEALLPEAHRLSLLL